MEQKVWSTNNSKRVETFLIACVLLFILVRLFLVVSIGHTDNVTGAYLIPMFILTGTLVWMRKGRPRDIETILLAAFAAWLAGTRILNGDKYLHEGYVYVSMIGFACLVLYPLPSVISDTARKKYLTAVELVFCITIGVAAWTGVIAVITNAPISNPFNDHVLGIDSARLWFFTAHPNGFSSLLYIALGLLLHLAVTFKHLWERLCLALLAVGVCLALYFTGCNAGSAVTILMLLAAAFLLLSNSSRISRKRLFVIVLAAVLLLALILAGTLVFYKFSSAGDAAQTETGDVFRVRFDEASGTFAYRIDIWKAGFELLREKPVRFLIGDQRNLIRMQIEGKMGIYLTHMHDSYMEVLMTGGIPALLIMLTFNILLVYRSIRLFFCKQAPIASKMLTLPLFGLLIHAITENYIFTDELQSMLFFLIAGMALFESRNWCSKKRIMQDSAA